MTDFINPIPESLPLIKPVEVNEDEQRTPKRIKTQYKTTGIFEDISEKSKESTEQDFSG